MTIICIKLLKFQILQNSYREINNVTPNVLYFVSLIFPSMWTDRESRWQLAPRADGRMLVHKRGPRLVFQTVSHIFLQTSLLPSTATTMNAALALIYSSLDSPFRPVGMYCHFTGYHNFLPFATVICQTFLLMYQTLSAKWTRSFGGNWKRTHILWVSLCPSAEEAMLDTIYLI